MRTLRPSLIIASASLAGVALFGAPAVSQVSEDREVFVGDEMICTYTDGSPAPSSALGQRSVVCVLSEVTQRTGAGPLAASGTDATLILAGLGFMGAGLLMRRASARHG